MSYKVEVKQIDRVFNGVIDRKIKTIDWPTTRIEISITPAPHKEILNFFNINCTYDCLEKDKLESCVLLANQEKKLYEKRNNVVYDLAKQITQLLKDNNSHSFDLV